MCRFCRRGVVLTAALGVGWGILALSPPAVVASSPASSGGTGAYVLTARDPGAGYAPTFTGNGELGVRVPVTGQGYAGGSVPAQSELAGFYAQPQQPNGYRVQVSTNGQDWTTVATVTGGHATTDVVHFAATSASFVRVAIDSSATSKPPTLDELTVTG